MNLEQLRDEIDMIRWELANGCYAGCTDEAMCSIANYIADLEAQCDELTSNVIW